MSTAASVAQSKRLYPEKYCRTAGCLWRVMTRGTATPCPKHPVPSPVPGYDAWAMTHHGGSVEAENRVDDRRHIANDAAEALELRACDEEMA